MDDREKALARLRELKDSPDVEGAHVNADDILCALLESLGYADVVQAYHNVPKWYA